MNEARLLLEISGLDVAYGDIQVIWDLSFAVEEGKVIAVVGANGAGKSTLLEILAGTTRPTAGSVEIDGSVAALPRISSAPPG